MGAKFPVFSRSHPSDFCSGTGIRVRTDSLRLLCYLFYPKITRCARTETSIVTIDARTTLPTLRLWEAADKAVADCTDGNALVREGHCQVLVVLGLPPQIPVAYELAVPLMVPLDGAVPRLEAAVVSGPKG